MPGQVIVLVDSDPLWRKNLKLILAKNGYKVIGVNEDGIKALKIIRLRHPDLVILDASVEGLEIARIVYEDKIAPVIAIASIRSLHILQKAKEANVSALLYKPVHEVELLSAIELALANHNKITKMEVEIKKLKETIENKKIIDQAKGILMEKMGLTEEEAFRRLQKQSMDSRISMRQVAEAVILSNKLKNI